MTPTISDATSERPRPWVAESIAELTAGASERSVASSTDGKSGARFERLVLDGERYFLKVLSPQTDWIMRCTGNTSHWEFQVWQAGLYQSVPEVIDPAMVGMALESTDDGTQLAMLMRDRSADLVPPGDALIAVQHHRDFIDHLAAMHAVGLGWTDTVGLCSMAARLLFFAPDTIASELMKSEIPVPIQVADRGWSELPRRSPVLADLVRSVHSDPDQLSAALASTPSTFVAGDWKLGNLGRRPEGHTVLLDWAYPGEAPLCWELAWYLALNSARMPESKEATIEYYRARLEAHGVDTDGWWDRQLGLCIIGSMAKFAWEKAVGVDEELGWWVEAASNAATWLPQPATV
jgi:phosphotransferase family enzyme